MKNLLTTLMASIATLIMEASCTVFLEPVVKDQHHMNPKVLKVRVALVEGIILQ